MTDRQTGDDKQELPEEMVSAWATVLLDIHERDQHEVPDAEVKDSRDEEV